MGYLQQTRLLRCRSQGSKIERYAEMKVVSAPSARTDDVVSAASRDKRLGGISPLLISISVLVTTIRTLPGNAVTGHPPEIFFHAVLAD